MNLIDACFSKLRREWTAIQQAPWSFGSVALILVAVAVFCGWQVRGQFNEERISNLQTLLDDYRSKVGATPDDAWNRIKKLESAIDALSAPPRIIYYDGEWEAQSDGNWKYRKKLHVSSRYVPEGLMIRVKKTEEFMDFSVAGLSDPQFLFKALPMTDENGWLRLYVRQPFGIYEVTVTLKSKEPPPIEGLF